MSTSELTFKSGQFRRPGSSTYLEGESADPPEKVLSLGRDTAAMQAPIVGGRNPTWSRGPAKALAASAAVFAVGAIVLVALLADAPDAPQGKHVERLSSFVGLCGQLGAAPCDAASVGHLRQVRAPTGSADPTGSAPDTWLSPASQAELTPPPPLPGGEEALDAPRRPPQPLAAVGRPREARYHQRCTPPPPPAASQPQPSPSAYAATASGGDGSGNRSRSSRSSSVTCPASPNQTSAHGITCPSDSHPVETLISASRELADCSCVGVLGVRYKFVNFEWKRTRSRQIGETKQTCRARTSPPPLSSAAPP